MIRSFRSKALKRYVQSRDRSKLSVVNLRRLDTILNTLDEAVQPDEMKFQAGAFMR